jgi:Tol biopolymer transport system component
VVEAPSWSPEKSKIAFQSDMAGNADLYVSNTDGSGLLQVTRGQGLDGGPDWSPDGKWIAFQRNGPDGHPNIFSVSADGTQELQLTNNEFVDAQPAWSPDGDSIAFMRNEGGVSDIYVLSVATEAERRITDGSGGASDPGWSPDGSLIAFTQDVDDNGLLDLVTVPSGGGSLTVVARDIGTGAASVRWAPSGQHIAFTSWVLAGQDSRTIGPDSAPRIWVAHVNSGVVTPLRMPITTGPLFDW